MLRARTLPWAIALSLALFASAPALGNADLQTIKSDAVDPIAPGATQTYTIALLNNGPDAAQLVALTDTLPAGTTFLSLSSPAGWTCTTPPVGSGGTVDCSSDSFAAFSGTSFTLQVVFDSGLQDGTVVTNQATVSAETPPEGNPGNETGSASTTVQAPGEPGTADLQLSKFDSPDPVFPGGSITYEILLTNAGPDTAEFVSLDDTLPAEVTFLALTPDPAWSCTTPPVGSGGTVSCSIDSLPVGTSDFFITVQVGSGVAPGTVITNTATASSETSDPDEGGPS
ncbi:MAG TPA: DUF11 domain-containing protein, partial [Thermoanaerobaculia bacterium]|nr:DUF11 domain-containing protein [Thermoanaerobaculia bacterium]